MPDSIAQTVIDLLSLKKQDEAYRFLHQQYYYMLLRFATVIVKETEPSEEIVSDILYKISANHERLLEISHLKIYLFTAVKNNCLRYISNKKREAEKRKNIFDSVVAQTDDDPEMLLINKQLLVLIKETINNLPPKCKIIFELVRVEGLRNKDVAKKLGISVNTVDNQLATALKRINKAINTLHYNKSIKFKSYSK